jgi:hypothetical protein
MPRDIRLLLVETRPDEPAYPTFDAAIAAIEREPRAAQAERDSALLKGRIVQDAKYTDVSLTLSLSGDTFLHLFLVDGITSWSIQHDTTAPEPSEQTIGNGDLLLQFPNMQYPYLWKRLELLRDLINKPILHIRACAAWLYLDVDNAPTLLFMRLAIRGSHKSLLFYAPE